MTVLDCDVALPEMSPSSMVGRMTLILDAFDKRTARLNLEEISTRTNLPRSTTHRILDQLVGLDWLEHTPPGYRLGRRALGLGGQDGTHGSIREAAADHLLDLHLRTGMVVHLAALDGSEEVYLDKVGGRFAMSLASRVGHRQPLHRTTGGRAMLAWLTPEDMEMSVREHVGPEDGADGWDLPALHAELHRIRRRHGLSVDRGELAHRMAGLTLPSVAAAIRGPFGPVAAICLCGQPKGPSLDRVAPLVVDAARRISAALFVGPRGASTAG